MGNARTQVDTVRVPLGSPDAMLLGGGGRQVLVLADPECPDDHVKALEMAGHALAAGVRVENYVAVDEHDLAGRIPRQLSGVERQVFGAARP